MIAGLRPPTRPGTPPRDLASKGLQTVGAVATLDDVAAR